METLYYMLLAVSITSEYNENMDTAVIIAKAMAQLFLVLFIGVIATKTGILNADRTKGLSELIMNITLPCMIAGSFFNANSPETLSNFLTAFWLSLLANIISCSVGIAFIRKKNNLFWQIERSTASFPNVGFIGLPLAQMLFGSEGALYISAYVATYNMVQWTYGEMLIGSFNKKSFLKTIRSPLLVASYIGFIVFFFNIPIPEIIVGGVKYVSNLNIALPMFIVANKLCECDLKGIVKSLKGYYVYSLKLIVAPTVFIIVTKCILHTPEKPTLSILMGLASPTAMAVTMLCVKYDKNPGYAAGLLSMTNILCILTIPVMALLYSVI